MLDASQYTSVLLLHHCVFRIHAAAQFVCTLHTAGQRFMLLRAVQDDDVHMRVLLDHSAVEIYIGSGEVLSTRVYRCQMLTLSSAAHGPRRRGKVKSALFTSSCSLRPPWSVLGLIVAIDIPLAAAMHPNISV